MKLIIVIAIPLLATLFGGAAVAAALADSTTVLGSSAATENEPIGIASPTHNYDNLNLRGRMLSMGTKSAKVDRMLMGSGEIFDHFDLNGKSKKKKKKQKKRGMDESELDTMKETVMEFGRPLQ
ncbi:hypothetical protein QTG54_006247 [Skeletonema marinoi]|uniref:RxLR effector protein n=1 Tax=Skeletonema marinoi TaxID=267567 RepID=A0AAD9DEC2_9STRA|nr:hypothetical protein QTG54_006247 [Skeletonema marinoi]